MNQTGDSWLTAPLLQPLPAQGSWNAALSLMNIALFEVKATGNVGWVRDQAFLIP